MGYSLPWCDGSCWGQAGPGFHGRSRSPSLRGGAGLAGHWIFGLTARCVRDVYVAGDRVVAGGRSTRLDAAALAAGSSAEAARLWARLDGIEPHTYTPGGRRSR